VLKSPFSADVDAKFRFHSRREFDDKIIEESRSSSKSLDLEFPISYGIGIGYRIGDIFTLSLDVYRTQWNDFKFKDSQGNEVSAITGKPSNESDIDPTYQIRLGAEYLLIKEKFVIPFRGGLFYDPAPAEGSPDNFYGFSLGTGIGVHRFAFDIAYQFRWCNDVGQYLSQYMPEDSDFSQDVREHTVYSSLIIYF
jgi:long-subunit fatty acid transport protein